MKTLKIIIGLLALSVFGFGQKPELILPTGEVFSKVAISPDGKYLAAGQRKLVLFETETTKKVKIFHDHDQQISSLCFSPDSKYILSGSYDSTVIIRYIYSGETKKFKHHQGKVTAIDVSPDGKYFISGSNDNNLKIGSINNNESVITLSGHTGKINSVEFSLDGRLVLSSSGDSTFKIWDWRKQRLIKSVDVNYSGKASFISKGTKVCSYRLKTGLVKQLV